MKNIDFKKSNSSDIPQIWEIIEDAIQRRKNDDSNQWQDGYPNPEVLQKDVEKGAGFVLTMDDDIVGYCAILINDEPEYENIEGKWLTNDDFVVFHRLAVAEKHIGKGLAKKLFASIEKFALDNQINSVKADTNFDNGAMLRLFETLGYTYCGEVYFRGSPRKAFEKVLV